MQGSAEFRTATRLILFDICNWTIFLFLGGETMANLKSAIKRVATNEKKHSQNQPVKSDVRTRIKHVEKLVEANDVENAKTAFQATARKIDMAVQKGVFHKNSGNRQKSRLAKKVNELGA